MPEDKKPVSPESVPMVQAESKPEPNGKKELAAPSVPAAQPASVKPAVETPKAAEPAPEAAPALETKKEDLKKEDPKAEYKRMFDAFGAEIASKIFIAGGKFEDAQKEYLNKLESENKDLKEKVKSFGISGEEPVKTGAEPRKTEKLFKTV